MKRAGRVILYLAIGATQDETTRAPKALVNGDGLPSRV